MPDFLNSDLFSPSTRNVFPVFIPNSDSWLGRYVFHSNKTFNLLQEMSHIQQVANYLIEEVSKILAFSMK